MTSKVKHHDLFFQERGKMEKSFSSQANLSSEDSLLEPCQKAHDAEQSRWNDDDGACDEALGLGQLSKPS